MIRIPEVLNGGEDAAVTCLREGCELHRLVREPTVGSVCGLVEGQLVHPFPSVSTASMYAASLCPVCLPQRSVWTALLRWAYPDPPRVSDLNSGPKFGPMNNSRRYR